MLSNPKKKQLENQKNLREIWLQIIKKMLTLNIRFKLEKNKEKIIYEIEIKKVVVNEILLKN